MMHKNSALCYPLFYVVTNLRKGSTIRVQKNSYSVPIRLIGEPVDVRIYGEWIEV